LVQQVAAGLRVQPYQDPQQQQQQQRRGARDSSSSSSSSGGGGYLRYLQLTALPSQAGGRAEDDGQAQVQVRDGGGLWCVDRWNASQIAATVT
jgi:hypothetical protein